MLQLDSAIENNVRSPHVKKNDSMSSKADASSKKPLLSVKGKSSRVDLKRIYKTKEFFDEVAVDNGALSPDERKRKLEEQKLIS